MSVTAVPIQPLKRGALVKLWIGIGVLALIAGALAWYGTARQAAMGDPAGFLAANAKKDGVVALPSGVQIQTITPGSGAKVGAQDGVMIEYKGRLLNGDVFDSTDGRGPAPLLVGGVVPGFSEALQQMQKGGSYRVWIPPALAYGEQVPPGGPIPPNAVLDFDVKVVDVAKDAAVQVQQMQQQQQMQQLEQMQQQQQQGGGR